MISLVKRETLIKKSKVRDIFVPSYPISRESLLFGRENEVKRLIGKISSPGGHAVLFGDRGVGKTSLANIVSLHYKELNGSEKVYTHSCNPDDDLKSIMRMTLLRYGVDINIKQKSTTHGDNKKAKIQIPVAGAELASNMSHTETIQPTYDTLMPSYIVDTLGKHKGLLIIDEVDVLENSRVIHELAILIKQLSDNGAVFKIMLVGIARTVQGLMHGHKSAGRAFIEVKLNRLNERELRNIIIEGGERLGLSFEDEVILHIAIISAGYPYFTHLIALKCAEEAVLDNRKTINIKHLPLALVQAADDAESSLRSIYQDAINFDETSLHAQLIHAAVLCKKTEFTTKEWVKHFRSNTNEKPSKDRIIQVLRELISSKDAKIFAQIKKNVFCFHDPRMPSYTLLSTFHFPE